MLGFGCIHVSSPLDFIDWLNIASKIFGEPFSIHPSVHVVSPPFNKIF